MPDEETCSLCDAQLDTTGYPLWCKSCRTLRKRALKEAHAQMATGKGFAAGAEQMRASQIAKLDEMASWATLEVRDVITWIREFPAPRPS